MLNGAKIRELETRLAEVEASLHQLAGGGNVQLLVLERGRACPNIRKFRELARKLGADKLRELIDQIKTMANVPKGPGDELMRYDQVDLASCAVVRCARWSAADDDRLGWWVHELEQATEREGK